MNEPTLPLDGLSPVRGKAVVARFDGGLLSSDSGVIALARWIGGCASPNVWRRALTIRARRTKSSTASPT